MKRIFTLLMAAASLMACTRTPYEEQIEIPGGFTATIEGVGTRTSMDGLKVLWASGDQVAVFAGKAINERYEVTKASVGKPSANFTKVGSSEGFGSDIPTNVAYYPYSSDVELDWSGEAAIYAALPATQTYAEGSFGQGAFPMMAVTKDASDRDFAFRNVCGVLKIQLTGSQKVKAIEFKGNNGEVISGDAVITSSYGEAPSVQMTGNGKAVTLDCGAGVQLGSDPTDFCIALPPVTFSKGFTVTVTDTDGMTMEISTDKSQTISRSGILKMPAKEYDFSSSVGQPSKELCFTAEKAGSKVALNKYDEPYDVPQEYCTDGEHWYPYTFGTAITLANVGDKVYFRKMTEGVAEGFSKYDTGGYNYYHFTMSGRLAASGNVMSLIDRTCQSTTIPNDYCFSELFSNCTALAQAPELPATRMADGCYELMFALCTALTQAPELPATTLADYCYYDLFYGCTALTEAPELPATTLANYCYRQMFIGCKSLTQAPELPATTLAEGCYELMFYNCPSLTQAPELPATTLAENCYLEMFRGCTALTQAPELPATTLADGCYQYMFRGCTSLTQAPELPATTLAHYCYFYMFDGCTALTQAPELPATTLESFCYGSMFDGCTSLTQAPELPATTLALGCYQYMFDGCTSLNEVRCYATDISASDATTSWLYNVSSTGTFYADPSANWNRGESGIPVGWTVKSLDGTSSTDQPSGELCFTAEQAGSTVKLDKDMFAYDVPQEYCSDGAHWYPYTFGTTITLANVGDKVYFRKMTDGVAMKFSNDRDGYRFAMTGRLAASGNVMSLVDRTCQTTTIPNDYCFFELFSDCAALTQAPELPATTLAERCYAGMFHSCTSLTQAPELPATTLALGCYSAMFLNCTALTQAPELPANTLAEWCYSSMFAVCASLTQVPELPATTLAKGCYGNMFEYCTSLTQAPKLPATTLAELCYSGMFSNCTSLTQAPVLPATTLAEEGYSYMFSKCTSLTQAPVLPATTLASKCYYAMFSGCKSLKQAPVLPSTTLAGWCYSWMFEYCTSLTQAPELPATTLASGCYERMFSSCSSLTMAPVLPAAKLVNSCYERMFFYCSSLKEVRCYATDISAFEATHEWLYAVNWYGTFYAAPSANWSSGEDGIPVFWTREALSE